MTGNRILIVDDETSICLLLKEFLEQFGYYVDTASNGSEAMDIVEGGAYDLVVSDIRMPVMDGMELLKRVKSYDPDIEVIMITGVADIDTAIDALKLGASDYIVKNFDLDAVKTSVSCALEKRRLTIESREYQLHLERKVEEQSKKLRELFLESLKALAYALEAKDSYTNSHSRHTTEYAVLTALELGLPDEMLEKIRLGGALHDIGKIGVKESVLNKPSALTEEEYMHVMRHPVIGEEILKPIIKDREILEIVRHHHERFDGNGLPDGLKGEGIPIGARILAVADAYHTMVSTRSYRKPLSHEAALMEIKRCSGTQFDPEVVDAFLRVVGENAIAHVDDKMTVTA